jgi:hypothetical protein
MPTSNKARATRAAASPVVPGRLASSVADVFAEVQRADTKAAAVCAATVGTAAITVAALSAGLSLGALPRVLLAMACVLQSLAFLTAVLVLRPATRTTGQRFLPYEGHTVEEVMARVSHRSAGQLARAEAERFVMLSHLAQRKYRLLRWAVDELCAALVASGLAAVLAWICD